MAVYPELNDARAMARDLYSQGQSLDAIAQTLKVSVMSLLRWRQQDMEMGRPWVCADRSEEPQAQLRVLLSSQLEMHLAALMREALWPRKKGRPRYPTYEDRMLKVCRVMEHLRPDSDDLTAQLEVMRGFARFCVRTLSEDEMGPVRKAVRLFLDDLQARNQ